MPSCFVPGCNSGYLSQRKAFKKLGKKVPSLFICTSRHDLEKWKRAISRADRPFTAKDLVCELHFDVNDIEQYYTNKISDGSIHILERGKRYLKSGCIPTIFPDCISVKSRKKKALVEHVPAAKKIEVCESNIVESDFENEACTHESETGRRPSKLLSNARLKKDVPSLLPNSRNYLSREKCRKQDLRERHIRLENEKGPSPVQQNLGSTKENQDEFVNASATFPVPINLLKQKDLNTSNSLHWNKNEATVLIALYQSEKCLYDKTHKHYYDLHKRNEARERIKNILANMNFICTTQQIKDKILSLYSKYAFEKAHKDRCIQAGQFTEDTYAPTMWCFGLLQFLDDFIEPMTEIDIETKVPEVNKRMQLSVSNNVNVIKIFSEDPEGKEDIFGEYIASEMKTLRDNHLIYMRTKQAIVNILTHANLDLLKS